MEPLGRGSVGRGAQPGVGALDFIELPAAGVGGGNAPIFGLGGEVEDPQGGEGPPPFTGVGPGRAAPAGRPRWRRRWCRAGG